MPAAFPEPRLSLPGSGLYASIVNVARGQTWRSASTVGVEAPLLRDVGTGQWRYEVARAAGRDYLGVATGVSWAGSAGPVPLVLSVFEDKAEFDREIAVFERTSWAWLGGAALLLLVSQTVLLRWGLAPLGAATREIRAIEHGEQTAVEGRYPVEVAALTDNLNTLIAQERLRQTRYREALSFLAHSLKTPLAVLAHGPSEPATLPGAVAAQVTRMDDIVQHQLGRAAASGASRFVPALALAPVLERMRDSLAKVYADKALVFTLDCAPALAWRIDEGDAFEMLGNLMDNAAKWAQAAGRRERAARGRPPPLAHRRRRARLRRHPRHPADPRTRRRAGARARRRPGGGQRPGGEPRRRADAGALRDGRGARRHRAADRLTRILRFVQVRFMVGRAR